MSFWAAVGTSVGYLVVALIAVWAVKRYLQVTETAVLASLLFLPLLLYLVFSGRLGEFKALGVEAKLVSASATAVGTDAIGKKGEGMGPAALLDTGDILGGDAPDANLEQAAFWAKAVHVVAIKASQWKNLSSDTHRVRAMGVGVVIYHSLLAGSLKAVVILDDERRPLGVFDAAFFHDMLRVPIDVVAVPLEMQDFVMSPQQVRALFQQTELWIILQNPAIRAENEGNKAWVSRRASRHEALSKMIEDRLEVLVITDDEGRYLGIVTRERLMGQLLLDATR